MERIFPKILKSLDTYALAKKEKKLKIQFYLQYPKPHTTLAIDQLKNIDTIWRDLETELNEAVAFFLLLPGGQVPIENNALSKICITCFCTFIHKCLVCKQNKAYAMSLTTDNVKES